MSNFINYLQEHPILSAAFKYITDNNKGDFNPYHNNFHLIDVFTTSMEIANTYDTLTDKDRLEIGLAALFHDFNHSAGKFKKDMFNIAFAINGLDDFLMTNGELVKDAKVDEFQIEEMINITEYPHLREPHTLKERIIRDSDMLQCYNRNWFLNVITGFLIKEVGMNIQNAIKNQIKYIETVIYYTDHAKYIHNKEQEKVLENLRYLADLYK